MTHTTASCAPASTAASSAPDRPATPRPGSACAIHQPNLFPRLATLAKLYAADRWIILDDVQFARRDYQHRTRLANLNDPGTRQWLTLPTHLPHGRPTLIHQARLAAPDRSRRTTAQLIQQHYGRSRYWHVIHEALVPVLAGFTTTDHLADIAETSTRTLLTTLGWHGEVFRSSELTARGGRSERLADLAAATGSTAYLCGTGGMRYLDPAPFDDHSIAVTPFSVPASGQMKVWRAAREVSALRALAMAGPETLAAELHTHGHRSTLSAPPHSRDRGPGVLT
ncbi:WbqC family protein [Streptomyces sp. NPDC055099]